MRFDLLHPKALRAALIESMGSEAVPTERQIRRWITGDTPIPGWAQRAISELMGTTKEAEPPDWATRLLERSDSILENQVTIIGALGPDARAELLIERLEQLLPLLGEGSPEETEPQDPAAGSPQGQVNG